MSNQTVVKVIYLYKVCNIVLFQNIYSSCITNCSKHTLKTSQPTHDLEARMLSATTSIVGDHLYHNTLIWYSIMKSYI